MLICRRRRTKPCSAASNGNGRKPECFPEVIVRAQSDGDITAAARFAKERHLKMGIRSGGHSWAASFPRDGGMLLDEVLKEAVHILASRLKVGHERQR